jgi:ABC-type transporter Mla subunit MlaD
MTQRAMRLWIGLFVVVAGLLLAALVVLFGSVPGVFKRSKVYTVRFTDAPGISPGTPVRRSGVRIGQVQEVVLDDERGIVRVKVAIDPQYALRHSEQPTLVIGLLGSDASIDFIPKAAEDGQPVDRSPLEPGAELVGVKAANVNTLLNRASEVVPTTQETLNDMRKSMQRLEKLAARLEKMAPVAEDALREYRDLAKATRQALPELQRTNEELRELARTTRQAVPEVRQTNKEIGDLAKAARQALPELQRTNEELRELARTTREAVPTVRGAVDDVGAAARTWTKLGERLDVFVQSNREKVEKTIENVNEATGRVNRLLNDENLRNVQSTLTNVRSASEPLPSISRSADDILKEGRTTVRRMNETLLRLDALATDLQKVTGPAGQRGESISRNLDEGLQKLNQTLGDVRALMQVLDRGNGTVQKLLRDPSLYNNLDAAAALLPKLVPRLDRILKDFETFADKLARHPEAIGLGGVVRPGSGLKNPPTPPIGPAPFFPPPPH